MKKYNIIHIRASNFYGGPERQLHFHAKLALDSIFDIIICSFLESGHIPNFLEVISNDGIETHAFNVKSAYDFQAVRLVKDYLVQNKIDILCTHDYRSHFIGWLAARKLKIKWFAFSRGWTSENIKIRIYQVFDKIIIRFADQIIAVSYSQKQKLAKLFIFEKKINVVYNSIDVAIFDKVEPEDLHSRFNFPENAVICITGGRFSAEKGQKYLIYAAKKALESNKNLRFVLFGDGPDLVRMRNLVKELKINDKVICPGFERNLIGCLKGADILINPSRSEGLPNIVLEAMAVKTPVIATAVGGVPELVENHVNGLLVPSENIEDLAKAILDITADKNMTISLTKAALERVKKDFSFRSQFEKLISLYEKIY